MPEVVAEASIVMRQCKRRRRIDGQRLPLASLLAFTIAASCFGGCRSPSVPNQSASAPPASPMAMVTSRVFEPSPATPVATTCDEAFGVTRVNQLFAALNGHDVQALGELLPPDGTPWDFEIQPDILLSCVVAGCNSVGVRFPRHQPSRPWWHH